MKLEFDSWKDLNAFCNEIGFTIISANTATTKAKATPKATPAKPTTTKAKATPAKPTTTKAKPTTTTKATPKVSESVKDPFAMPAASPPAKATSDDLAKEAEDAASAQIAKDEKAAKAKATKAAQNAAAEAAKTQTALPLTEQEGYILFADRVRRKVADHKVALDDLRALLAKYQVDKMSALTVEQFEPFTGDFEELLNTEGA